MNYELQSSKSISHQTWHVGLKHFYLSSTYDYFLYYEELDWSVSIRRQGYRLLFFPTSVVFHKESQSTGSDSPLKLYYITRNRFLFSKRNSPFIFHLATCLFLLAVVIPRLSIQLLCQRRFVHLRYVYMAIGDFFVGNYFQMKK